MSEFNDLSRAQQLYSAGRAGEGLALLTPSVNSGTKNVQLLMAAGMMARDTGNLEFALGCFERAQTASAQDPKISNIYGNTLAAAGQTQQAMDVFEKVLRAYPQELDAHINRAITAQKIDEKRALNLIEASLESLPDKGRLWSIKGTILKNLNRINDAIDAFDRSLELEPGRALTMFNRGVALRAAERHQEALDAYEALDKLGMKAPQIDSAKAAVLLELDQVERAQELYMDAFRKGDAEAGAALVRLRHEYLQEENPFQHLSERARAQPSNPVGWHGYLSALLEYGDYDQLLSASKEAKHFGSDNKTFDYFGALGEAWAGNRQTALQTLDTLLEYAPNDEVLNLTLAEVRLANGDPILAEQHAAKVIETNRYSQAGWAYRATAWRVMDDPRRHWLSDYDTFVTVHDIGASSSDTADYISSLAEGLRELHRAKQAPGNQSLRHGTQTSGSLFNRPEPFIREFQERLHSIIKDRLSTLPADDEHPFLSRQSQSITFQGSWSVCLSGEGHHVPHFHDQGWMSSAYYAQLPSTLGQAGDHSGWLQLGSPPKRLGLNLGPERLIEPKAGQLVLFPSYMWHGTLPFFGKETRLTAAFDVVPA